MGESILWDSCFSFFEAGALQLQVPPPILRALVHLKLTLLLGLIVTSHSVWAAV